MAHRLDPLVYPLGCVALLLWIMLVVLYDLLDLLKVTVSGNHQMRLP